MDHDGRLWQGDVVDVHRCRLSDRPLQVTFFCHAWCIVTLNAARPDGTREREILACSPLLPDTDFKQKTGVNVGGAVIGSIEDYTDVQGSLRPTQMDFCIADR